jgi:hypothetical protein
MNKQAREQIIKIMAKEQQRSYATVNQLTDEELMEQWKWRNQNLIKDRGDEARRLG